MLKVTLNLEDLINSYFNRATYIQAELFYYLGRPYAGYTGYLLPYES